MGNYNNLTVVYDNYTAEAIKWAARKCEVSVAAFLKCLIDRELDNMNILSKYQAELTQLQNEGTNRTE